MDYVDPDIPDVTFKRTESFSVNLTPGGTYTEITAMRQSDGTLTIRYQYHLTVVDGEPKIEREAFIFDGCPQWAHLSTKAQFRGEVPSDVAHRASLRSSACAYVSTPAPSPAIA